MRVNVHARQSKMLRHRRRASGWPPRTFTLHHFALAGFVASCHRIDRKTTIIQDQTMSQRTIQQSVTEFLDADADEFEEPDVQQTKRTTAVDVSICVHLGVDVYHRYLSDEVCGCPNHSGATEVGTIEDAIEAELRPCGSCNPPDYREKDNTIPIPPTKPTQLSDLDTFIVARGNLKKRGHIASRGGDHPVPLCARIRTYGSSGDWTIKSQEAYPSPDQWFSLCSKCQDAYDIVAEDH
jgi:hypothetical protein